MAFVPAVPDGDVFPIVLPLHVEKAVAPLFKDLHAIAFYYDLARSVLSPLFQEFFCIVVPHDHDVKGLTAPEIAYGHQCRVVPGGTCACGVAMPVMAKCCKRSITS